MEEEFQDETIVCLDCGQEFTFTAGEQAFYKEKGLQNKPKRCPSCRMRRKQQRMSKPEGEQQQQQEVEEVVEQPKREF